jgi:glutamate-1-semialdehyde 2,1-aminomutase
MSRSEIEKLSRKSRSLIPGGCQTISKRSENFCDQGWPTFYSRADGSQVFDLNGVPYTDYVLALGPIILGYNHPAVNERVKRQIDIGILTSLQSPLEVELSEKLVDVVPCAEMVRLFKTGADAVSAGVRTARAITGRSHVLSCGYSGWHDWWVAKNPYSDSAKGVLAGTSTFTHDIPYGNVPATQQIVDEIGSDIACIVVEPKISPDGDYLKSLREISTRCGAVLIFDEIVTGFRLALGGAQEYYGVTPDLSTLGKGMANGYPLSALVGKKDLMCEMESLWISSTYAGESASMAASLATIEELEKAGTYQRLWSMGDRLIAAWRAMTNGSESTQILGGGPIPQLRLVTGENQLDVEAERSLIEHFLSHGILWRRDHGAFLSLAHSDSDIDRLIEISAAKLQQGKHVV